MMTGDPRWVAHLEDHVTTITVSPDSSRGVAGSLGGDFVMFDMATGAIEAKLPGHPLGVLTSAWSRAGDRIASGGQDGVVRIADHDGTPAGEVTTGRWISAVDWSPSGVLAAASGRELLLVDRDGALLHRYPAAPSTITATRWSTNGTRVATAAYGGLTWYDIDRLPDDRPSRRHEFKGSPLALALSPNGRWACAGYQDASIHIWRLWSGEDLTMSGYPAKIEVLAFRDDGRWLAAACLDELTVWDFNGRSPKGTRPAMGSHTARITALAWEPNGSLLAVGDAGGTMALWPSPRSVSRTYAPVETIDDDAPVSVVVWAPNGRSLIVGRGDGTVEMRAIG
ncbi:MAG: WD40 repeat domain-containing protein [Acidimicrobiia bacterium]